MRSAIAIEVVRRLEYRNVVGVQGMAETQCVGKNSRRDESWMVSENNGNGHPYQSICKYKCYNDAYSRER